jgi:carbonic anhydrase/acetyltransferase-like protein (isoleucine patch superfamily)
VLQPLLGSPFAPAGLRLMGCKIGRGVFMDTTLFSEFDLAEISDYAAVNYGATVQTHLFEDRIMKAGRLNIGRGAAVGNMAVVLYNTEMQTGSYLAPLSVLMKGESLPPHSRWYGVPTQPMPASRPPVLPSAGIRKFYDEFRCSPTPSAPFPDDVNVNEIVFRPTRQML